MGKPESLTKKKEKSKPPVSKTAVSELPFYLRSKYRDLETVLGVSQACFLSSVDNVVVVVLH